ncbi:polymorphic toxin-type HINT domain-containing protein [Micromonospora sp. NPDC005174]
MADGTFKPISDLRVGDRVLATDPEAGVTNGKIVTHIWIHEDHLRDLKINGKALFTTAGHPFWNARVKRWDPANQLKSHDRLLSLQGVSIRLDGGLAQFARFGAAYNLTVADIHTYYVVAGNTPVLVHNTGCGPTARFAVDSSGVAADLKPLGRGSTGRTAPNNLTEQMAMHEAMSSPANGTLLPLRKGMTDARWPGSDGWVKMSQNVNGVEIHYVMNAITGQVDDFKFKG